MADPVLEKELRRQRSTLRSLGTGVLAFGLWAALKPLLILLLTPPQEVAESLAGLTAVQMIVVLAIVELFVLLVVSVRLWLGLSARAEGLGKARGRAYVVVAFAVFAVQIVLLGLTLFYLPSQDFSEESVLDTLASLVVEVTSLCIMGEMAFTARKVKRLSRQAGEGA